MIWNIQWTFLVHIPSASQSWHFDITKQTITQTVHSTIRIRDWEDHWSSHFPLANFYLGFNIGFFWVSVSKFLIVKNKYLPLLMWILQIVFNAKYTTRWIYIYCIIFSNKSENDECTCLPTATSLLWLYLTDLKHVMVRIMLG